MSFSQSAAADDLSDVTQLLREGQTSGAMTRIDAFLDKHPRDMQMRFVKGVALTEQGKTSEAIAVFTRLTEDHPDLPEPYNNLAVLFAAGGQYDKARAALDMAIRTNPSYATAYENLGDVHAKLASQAYDKALQLDSGNANAKSKLTLLRTLRVTGPSRDVGGKAAAAPNVVARADSPPVAMPTPKGETKPVARVDIKDEVKRETKPALKPQAKEDAPQIAGADTKIQGKSVLQPTKPATSVSENDEVLSAVNDWAAAWSAQDVKRYLAHYGSDFETPRRESRKVWAEERTSRITGKGRISVKVDAPQVSVNGSTATVKFRQIYVSDRLHADSRKTLTLSKQSGRWQIKQERTGT
ncbi:MAG: hypothetical protein NVSMB6_22250 [Burkholderiaceae bacterium]